MGGILTCTEAIAGWSIGCGMLLASMGKTPDT